MTSAVKKSSIPEELKLQNTSYELFTEVMNTVPIDPKYVEVSFLAGGVLPPRHQNDKGPKTIKDRGRYLDECNKKGVMPFTNLDFEWDKERGLFVPLSRQDTAITSIYYSGHPIQENEIEHISQGGKIHRLEFKARPREFTESRFAEFKKNLARLSLKGYQMWCAELSLTVGYQGGYDENTTYGDTEVYLSTLRNPIERELRVKIGRRDTSDEETQKVMDWFNGLKQKYESK